MIIAKNYCVTPKTRENLWQAPQASVLKYLTATVLDGEYEQKVGDHDLHTPTQMTVDELRASDLFDLITSTSSSSHQQRRILKLRAKQGDVAQE